VSHFDNVVQVLELTDLDGRFPFSVDVIHPPALANRTFVLAKGFLEQRYELDDPAMHARMVDQILSHCWHVAGNAATIAGMTRTALQQSAPATDAISYAG
jgi:hypothetical protein